eukprot:3522938-Ditylum_brightwellii.AAC.1
MATVVTTCNVEMMLQELRARNIIYLPVKIGKRQQEELVVGIYPRDSYILQCIYDDSSAAM